MFDLNEYPSTCPVCKNACEAVRFAGKEFFLCPPCEAAESARKTTLERRERCLARWADITPDEFQEKIDPFRINSGIVGALELSGKEGVGLIGHTDAGKTRVGYRLLKKAAAAGLTPYAVTCSRFRQAASGRHDPDGVNAEILKAARFCQCLLLDDVGKGARTETADEALFDLLDERRAQKRVTIWTSNGNGRWIAGRFGPDKGAPIAVRLANLAGCSGKGTGRIYTAV